MTTIASFSRIIRNKVATKLYVELLKKWHNSVSLSRFLYKNEDNARPNVANYFSDWVNEGYLTGIETTAITQRKSKFGKKEEYSQNKRKYRADAQALIKYCEVTFSWKPKKRTVLFLNSVFDNDLERSNLLRDIDKPRFNVFERLLATIRDFLLEDLQNYSSFIKYVKSLDKNNRRLPIERLLVKYPNIISDMVRGPFANDKFIFWQVALEITEECLETISVDNIDEGFFKEMEKLFPEHFSIVRGLARQVMRRKDTTSLERSIHYALIQQMKKRYKSFNVFKAVQRL